MQHGRWSSLMIGMLALFASSCQDRSEPISPEPASRGGKVEETLYIDSATVDWKLYPGARIVPEQAQGQVIGVRIFIGHVDGPEPTHAFGFDTADRIEAIDGVLARTTAEVFDAFARVRDMREVRFDVSRRGRMLRLVFRPSRAGPSH